MPSKFTTSIVSLLPLLLLTVFGPQASSSTPRLDIVPKQHFEKVSKSKAKFKSVRAGETVTSILKDSGFRQSQVNLVLGEGVLPKKFTLSIGQKYKVSKGLDGRFAELRFFSLPSDTSYVFWRDHDEAGAFETEMPLAVKLRTVQGKVVGSILASIKSKVNNDWVAMRFMDAYKLDYNLRKTVQRGAVFSLTFEEKYDGNYFIGYGEVTQTQLQINGKVESRHFVAFSADSDERGGSFIDAFNPHAQRPLYSPVSYMRISSEFSPRRFHPIRRRTIAHMGIDFELPQGESVFSARSGTIVRMGRNRAAGNFVVVRHSGGIETFYNHLHTIANNLRSGLRVRDGQLLGTIGCTGYCTKPHLHFAVKKHGRYVDPARYIKSYPYNQKALIRTERASLEKDSRSL